MLYIDIDHFIHSTLHSVSVCLSFGSMQGNTVQVCSAPVSPSAHQVGFPIREWNLLHPKYWLPPIFSPDQEYHHLSY